MKRISAGFTIVELAIVIVVIGILASITLVVYSGVKDRAILATATNDLARAYDEIKVFKMKHGAYPTSISACPNPSPTELCLSVSGSGGWLYDATPASLREPEVVIAAMNDKQFKLSTKGEMTSTNEFVRTFDLAPVVDKYGLVEYQIDFDIISANPTSDDSVQVYMQNGSGAKYYFLHYVTVSDSFQHKSFTFTPRNSNGSLMESYLAFYGSYGTGNIPTIKNIEMSLAN